MLQMGQTWNISKNSMSRLFSILSKLMILVNISVRNGTQNETLKYFINRI